MANFSPETHRARDPDYKLVAVHQGVDGGSIGAIYEMRGGGVFAATLMPSGLLRVDDECEFDLLPIEPEVRWDELPKGTAIKVSDCGNVITREFYNINYAGLIVDTRGQAWSVEDCRLAHPKAVHPYYRNEKPAEVVERKAYRLLSSREDLFREERFHGKGPDGKPWPPVVNGRVVE